MHVIRIHCAIFYVAHGGHWLTRVSTHLLPTNFRYICQMAFTFPLDGSKCSQCFRFESHKINRYGSMCHSTGWWRNAPFTRTCRKILKFNMISRIWSKQTREKINRFVMFFYVGYVTKWLFVIRWRTIPLPKGMATEILQRMHTRNLIMVKRKTDEKNEDFAISDTFRWTQHVPDCQRSSQGYQMGAFIKQPHWFIITFSYAHHFFHTYKSEFRWKTVPQHWNFRSKTRV